MLLYLRKTTSGKTFVVLLALVLLTLFISFLLFEVFDIDGSNILPLYWLEEGLVLEASALHRALVLLFAQQSVLWSEFFIFLLMLVPLIARTRKQQQNFFSRIPRPGFCQRLLARSNLAPEAATRLF